MTVEEKVAVIQGLEDDLWELLAHTSVTIRPRDVIAEEIERYQRIRANLKKENLVWCACRNPGELHLLGSVVCDNRMPGG